MIQQPQSNSNYANNAAFAASPQFQGTSQLEYYTVPHQGHIINLESQGDTTNFTATPYGLLQSNAQQYMPEAEQFSSNLFLQSPTKLIREGQETLREMDQCRVAIGTSPYPSGNPMYPNPTGYSLSNSAEANQQPLPAYPGYQNSQQLASANYPANNTWDHPVQFDRSFLRQDYPFSHDPNVKNVDKTPFRPIGGGRERKAPFQRHMNNNLTPTTSKQRQITYSMSRTSSGETASSSETMRSTDNMSPQFSGPPRSPVPRTPMRSYSDSNYNSTPIQGSKRPQEISNRYNNGSEIHSPQVIGMHQPMSYNNNSNRGGGKSNFKGRWPFPQYTGDNFTESRRKQEERNKRNNLSDYPPLSTHPPRAKDETGSRNSSANNG